MTKRCYSPEQIIEKLRGGEVWLSRGLMVREAVGHIGISEHTYYHWRKEYGGMRPLLPELRKGLIRIREALEAFAIAAQQPDCA